MDENKSNMQKNSLQNVAQQRESMTQNGLEQEVSYQPKSPQGVPENVQRPFGENQQNKIPSSGTSKKSAQTRKTVLISALSGVLAAVLVICIGFGCGFLDTGKKGASTTLGSETSTTINVADATTDLAPTVAQKCLPSVVSIDVYTQTTTGYYGQNTSQNNLTQSSLGSGVVLSADGYIVTNYHVIEGSSALKVNVDGNTYDADIVGSDQSSDVAVIKARDANNLTPIELGDSDSLTIGQWVMSIGSPFGLEQSVATGVVSATSRSQVYDNSSSSNSNLGNQGSYTLYVNLIQTDAAINPGNSGGALVDQNGKLIGINTLITSYSGTYSGVGFAIPSNYAVSIAQQIINGETPTHAQLGVTLSSVNSSNAKRYGLSVDSGAYVASIMSGSSASNSGIQQGDIIVKFDNEDITSASDLMLAVRKKKPGDTVDIELVRDGNRMTVSATLGSDADSASNNGSSGSSRNLGLVPEGSDSGNSTYGDIFDYLYGNK